ncbi:MAG: thrombospondin type 3 repeat-containing protein [Thermodesulfobacteriota bacterium]
MKSAGSFLSPVIRALSVFVISCLIMTGGSFAANLEIDNQNSVLGGNVVFSVTINDAPNPVYAFGFEVAFDSTRLSYQSIARGDLTLNFTMLDANEYAPGVLRIGGFWVGNEIPVGSSGVLVTITFQVADCLGSNLHLQDLVDCFADLPCAPTPWTTRDGLFTCTGDGDGDGIQNAADNCPEIFNPAQTDRDNDGTGDDCDGCPDDPGKTGPGICGCGILDADTDGDGSPDCNDACPQDPDKVAPGVCGCGVPDIDSDGDGSIDCHDNCPDDPEKTEPGVCGCGTADIDTDGDGTLDCHDACPDDPAKTAPGVCGCGTAETDTDGDGTPDCRDTDDTDSDGKKDKNDNCPAVPNPGQEDADDDGTGDACDACPTDPDKIDPGDCGCGVSDKDSDGDGTADCIDGCPKDPNKTDPGVCGCGRQDIDRNGDGTVDCPGGGDSGLFGCFLNQLWQ